MTGAPIPSFLDELAAGARWSGPHDADLDGVVQVRTDWARVPLAQVLMEAQRLRLPRDQRQHLDTLIASTTSGQPGAEATLRAYLLEVA